MKPATTPDTFRRRFLRNAAIAGYITGTAGPLPSALAAASSEPGNKGQIEPFHGAHQAGITTPIQRHTYFIAFDLTTGSRDDVVKLLKAWTDATAQMTAIPARFDTRADPQQPSTESGATVGLSPSRLTVTFGFGAGLFTKDGKDRYGLAKFRPEALVDLPRFVGDQLVPERTGGDLSIQASADDFQVVEWAVRRLVKLANGIAEMRWAQTGFTGGFKPGTTGRNQMGFLDGTINVPTQNTQAMNQFVWVGDEGPHWMHGGSYMVIRPIRISLDHWDDMKIAFQEETMGRHKASGAPIGKQHEFDPLGLDREDKDGNPVIAEFSHAALSAPENNHGAQILRRAFNYDNGITKVAERWPPWRQLVTFDAGLLFQCYQKDPRTGFISIFGKMAQFDMLNQFATHTGSGLFACPGGVPPGGFVGQNLFA
ncbi:MAG: Dyp-type peroxidase [Proteobacteria bacterium]|nr:Dyp-type peroxidase [Pseudomonadota bacterium]HQR04726.1 Dyp-type peroxidase [Rhodocyclaceae bacterium]